MPIPIQDWFTGFLNGPDFIRSYPYYAAVLARMQAVDDPNVPVMAVSAHGRHVWLHVNVAYFLRPENFRYLKGVLLHEVHHIVLGHLGNPEYAGLAHPDLMELAMEVSANEYIRDPLPGDPPVWTMFKDYGVKPGQSTLERYDLLVKARQGGAKIPVPSRWVDTHLPRGVGQGRGGRKPPPGTYLRVKRMVSSAVAAAQRERQRAGMVGSPGGALAGREPGAFIEELDDFDEFDPPPPPRMDWRTALRLFAAPLRRPFGTYARPNRRFRERVGEIPGRIRRPDVAKPKRLVVAVDTSASMTTPELHEIAGELRRLSELAKFTVVECDTVIHRVYPFEGAFRDAAGRGGTDLRPVFESNFLAEHRPDGVVYFTDGEGPYHEKPPGVPVLWVLTKTMPFRCPWGQKSSMRG